MRHDSCRRGITLCVIGLLSSLIVAIDVVAQEGPFVKIKRAALWVPDLDRAIVFYRDVLGFTVESISDAEVMDDAVVYDLYNADSKLAVRRALFSSSTEKRGLFVMEAKDAPVLERGQQRYASLVIQTDNLGDVEERAKAMGFELGAGNIDSTPEGSAFKERVIIGPGGQAVLVYQYGSEQ